MSWQGIFCSPWQWYRNINKADLSTPALNYQKHEMSSFANSLTLWPSVTDVQRGSTLGRWENWMGRPAGTSILHFTSFSSIKANLSQLGHLLLKFWPLQSTHRTRLCELHFLWTGLLSRSPCWDRYCGSRHPNLKGVQGRPEGGQRLPLLRTESQPWCGLADFTSLLLAGKCDWFMADPSLGLSTAQLTSTQGTSGRGGYQPNSEAEHLPVQLRKCLHNKIRLWADL